MSPDRSAAGGPARRRGRPAPTAAERARRILAIVPWIAERPGVRVDEVADRFGLSREEIVADLDVVLMIGVPPYTPDTYVDVYIDDDDSIHISLGEFFRRPLRLTPDQALALIAAGRGYLGVQGADAAGPLARGLNKLETGVNRAGDGSVGVHLGEVDPEIMGRLRSALATGHRVRMRYYTYGRDAEGEREVDPWSIASRHGAWYLFGHCHQAEDSRVFRLDRIRGVDILDRRVETAPAGEPDGIRPGPHAPLVTLVLPPECAWVLDAYPLEEVSPGPRGGWEVTMRVSGRDFLARLLLRLGPDVPVRGDERIVAAGRDAARRALRVYRSSGGGGDAGS